MGKHTINFPFLTEFLLGDSEPLGLFAFCASDVPNLSASYTGSTLFPQALERNEEMIKLYSKQEQSTENSHMGNNNTINPGR